MKNFLFILMIFMSLSVHAQDVVITKEGDALKVYGLEVSATAVFYRESPDENASIVRKNKSDLLMIKYSDGRKVIINENNNLNQSIAVSQQPEATVSAEFTEADKAANEIALAKWNNFPEGKMKATKKKAVILYCVLRPDRDSRIADTNVELSFKTGGFFKDQTTGTSFILSVKNKTRKTIYLDLGNSFFIRGEQAEPYYIPTANSSTTGTSTGVGVNMGAVAGAIGIGGSAGKLANGINVAKGSSNYNTTITYSQRVIAIPPMSTKDLDEMRIVPFGKSDIDPTQFYGNIFDMKSRARYGTGTKLPHLLNIGTTINLWATNNFEEGQISFKTGTFLTYSFTEDIQSPRSLQANFSVRRIMGVPETKSMMIAAEGANLKGLTPQQLNDIFFVVWQEED